MLGHSSLCDNCNSESGQGRELLDGKFLCTACIRKVQWVLDRRNSWNTVPYGILAALFLAGLFLAFVARSLTWVYISGATGVLYFSYFSLRRTQTRKCVAYLDNWFDYPPDWPTRRSKVIQRDGHSCTQCRARIDLQVHHITPLRNGGNHVLPNLTTLCVKCHSGAGGRHSQLIIAHNRLQIRKRWAQMRLGRFTERRARKNYSCFICGAQILAGDQYVFCRRWDARYQVCVRCWNQERDTNHRRPKKMSG